MFFVVLFIGVVFGYLVAGVLVTIRDADNFSAVSECEILHMQLEQMEHEIEQVRDRAVVNMKALRDELERLQLEKNDLVQGAIEVEEKYKNRLRQADEQIEFERRKQRAVYIEGFEKGLNQNVSWGGVA